MKFVVSAPLSERMYSTTIKYRLQLFYVDFLKISESLFHFRAMYSIFHLLDYFIRFIDMILCYNVHRKRQGNRMKKVLGIIAVLIALVIAGYKLMINQSTHNIAMYDTYLDKVNGARDYMPSKEALDDIFYLTNDLL